MNYTIFVLPCGYSNFRAKHLCVWTGHYGRSRHNITVTHWHTNRKLKFKKSRFLADRMHAIQSKCFFQNALQLVLSFSFALSHSLPLYRNDPLSADAVCWTVHNSYQMPIYSDLWLILHKQNMANSKLLINEIRYNFDKGYCKKKAPTNRPQSAFRSLVQFLFHLNGKSAASLINYQQNVNVFIRVWHLKKIVVYYKYETCFDFGFDGNTIDGFTFKNYS